MLVRASGGRQPPGSARQHRGADAPRSPARPGISLIEVLVALAIFLMAIVAIGRLVDLGLDSALAANHQATGIRLAQSKLAEAEAGVIAVADGGASGTFDDEPDWQFTLDAGPTDLPNLYAVTVTVSRTSGRKHSVTMTQMVFDPTQMGTATPATKPDTSSSGTSGSNGGTSSGGTGP